MLKMKTALLVGNLTEKVSQSQQHNPWLTRVAQHCVRLASACGSIGKDCRIEALNDLHIDSTPAAEKS